MRALGTVGAGRRPDGWQATFVGLLAAAGAGFLLAPGDLVDKARLALHGLCAQRPAHTLALGDTPLPFDARMTGLYLGAVVIGLPLLAAGRRGLALTWGWLALLVGGVAIMGLDGVNSLRVDLGLPAWWPPDNRLRLGTGLLAGASLAVGLVWLLRLAFWPADGPLLRGADAPRGLAGLALAGAVVLSGAGWALAPVTLLLVGAAVLTVLALNLAVLGLVSGPAGGRRRLAQWASLALTAALIELALLAGGRYALEAALLRGGV